MPTPPPARSHAENLTRAAEKRTAILEFLDGEVYTTATIVSDLLACSRPTANRTLSSMVKARELKSEPHFVEGHKVFVYGITQHGLALANGSGKAFELGRTSSAYIPHHIQTQRARLSAERAGWTNWKPGKTLYNQNLKKVPDAIGTSAAGLIIGVEIECHVKSSRRLEEIVAAHLQSVSKSLWREVHYLCPLHIKKALQNAFERIKTVPIQNTRVALTPAHRNCFKFFSYEEWPPKN